MKTYTTLTVANYKKNLVKTLFSHKKLKINHKKLEDTLKNIINNNYSNNNKCYHRIDQIVKISREGYPKCGAC